MKENKDQILGNIFRNKLNINIAIRHNTLNHVWLETHIQMEII